MARRPCIDRDNAVNSNEDLVSVVECHSENAWI